VLGAYDVFCELAVGEAVAGGDGGVGDVRGVVGVYDWALRGEAADGVGAV